MVARSYYKALLSPLSPLGRLTLRFSRSKTWRQATQSKWHATWAACGLEPDGERPVVLLDSCKLASELERLELVDEYQHLVHPRITSHVPTLYENGLPNTRRLELISVKPFRKRTDRKRDALPRG